MLSFSKLTAFFLSFYFLSTMGMQPTKEQPILPLHHPSPQHTITEAVRRLSLITTTTTTTTTTKNENVINVEPQQKTTKEFQLSPKLNLTAYSEPITRATSPMYDLEDIKKISSHSTTPQLSQIIVNSSERALSIRSNTMFTAWKKANNQRGLSEKEEKDLRDLLATF